MENGDNLRKKFIEECIQDTTRFEKPIKKQKIHTFAEDNAKYTVTSADKKLLEVGIARDIFGSILYLALEKKVDMEEVLMYPLAPVPFSLCHIDGSMLKSPKSKLMAHLEKQAVNNHPQCIDSTIIDAMFFLHLQKNLPETYQAVSRNLFVKIVNTKGRFIHFVSDKNLSPSIKDVITDLQEEVSCFMKQ